MVGETCAVLLPYIPNALISSLVFSILQQLALEDKDIQVRQCAISRFVSCSMFMNSIKNDRYNERQNIFFDEFLRESERLLKEIFFWKNMKFVAYETYWVHTFSL